MNAQLLTPSKYIKAAALNGKDCTVTITGVALEELECEDKSKETKGLVSIAGTPKKWVLNVTNVKCLIQLFGNETDHWVGKKVTLYPEKNEMSESGFAIRVRGSPDIAADVRFTLKLARKKPRQVTLKKTGNGASAPASSATVSSDKEPPEDAGTFDEPSDEDEPPEESEPLTDAQGNPL